MGIHEWIRTGICPKMDATNYNNLQRKIMKHHHEIWGVLYFQLHPGIYGNYDREHGVVNHWIWVCQYEQKRPNLWEDWAHSVFVHGLVALGSAEFLAIPFCMSWPLPNIWSVVFSRPLVNCYRTMKNHHFQWVNSLYMAIFNSYVSHYQRVALLELGPSENPRPGSLWPSTGRFQGSQIHSPWDFWGFHSHVSLPKDPWWHHHESINPSLIIIYHYIPLY